MGYTMMRQDVQERLASEETESLEKKFEILKQEDARGSDDDLVDIAMDSHYPQICVNKRNLTDEQLRKIEEEDEIVTESMNQLHLNEQYF